MQEADFPGAWRPDQSQSMPLFEQLRRHVADLVTVGGLPAGRRLPPVRSLAAELGVAPHTVARAYRELEEAKIVVTRGRAGTVVAPRDAREQELTTAAAAYAAAARARGCELEEAVRLLEQAYSRL
ncbi:GntR family transcriptional regulator [Sinomonas sp. ASV322]|uniref:GntR family transcriptional regulator n=1 Tax=Sinomonas sp. ASV322 TaxID=3041920 RepID=UPI0027DC7A07|nr:GntR family transcriptional regulator [Sinomonas sp. ASV322]MDQ4500952.1 GntR family transcriptional regulator [Sinomonas sp. ASV322]